MQWAHSSSDGNFPVSDYWMDLWYVINVSGTIVYIYIYIYGNQRETEVHTLQCADMERHVSGGGSNSKLLVQERVRIVALIVAANWKLAATVSMLTQVKNSPSFFFVYNN